MQIKAHHNGFEAGLTQQEAVLRQAKYGLNEVKTQNHPLREIALRQVKSPFFYLLLVAGLLALVIGEKVDGLVILVFVALNFTIGLAQEYRAQRTVALLQNIIAQKVRVLRGGVQTLIDKIYLVPGDVVDVTAGDIIPAELMVIKGENILVDESALTGESFPVPKSAQANGSHQSNVLSAGTGVISGEALALVTATGKDTALGRIITSTVQSRHQSSYEKNLAYFCRLVLKIVLATMAVIFVLNLLLKGPAQMVVFLLFCMALVVSILPEALPAVVIVALSRGSLKMAKNHVVVKRLSAVEDLGNIEILCSDKTGTLTQNVLSLEKIVAQDNEKALLYALLGANSQGTDPFEAAFSKRAGYATLERAKEFTVVTRLPFDSFRMRSSVVVQVGQGQTLLITKGAVESVLKICKQFGSGFDRQEIKEDTEREGHNGKRALAVAYKKLDEAGPAKDYGVPLEKAMTFLGYFVFEDPLKPTAQEAVRLSKKMGLAIKMITGDSKEVAGYVAKQVGLVDDSKQVAVGGQLDAMPAEEFDNACRDFSVFARVSPNIKHAIIQSLQKQYEVGFLGEGMNDAPALKAADVGIAVNNATDIARSAADVILLKKDLRVVIEGINNGRLIFANINKYIKCALASNVGNFYSIAVISLFVPFLPMLPVQILLGNLLSDFPLIAIAGDSVDLQELRKPKLYELHMVLPLIISLALVSTVFDFIFFTIFHAAAEGQIQTLWFVMSILTEIALIFIIRTRRVFWRAKKPGFWLLFFTIIDAGIIIALPFLKFGQDLFHFVWPPLSGLLIVFVLVAAYFAASEMVKLVYFHYWKLAK